MAKRRCITAQTRRNAESVTSLRTGTSPHQARRKEENLFKLGWFVNGYSPKTWTGPWAGNHASEWTGPNFWIDVARGLERGGFDMFFMEDSAMVEDTYGGNRGDDTQVRRDGSEERPDAARAAAEHVHAAHRHRLHHLHHPVPPVHGCTTRCDARPSHRRSGGPQCRDVGESPGRPELRLRTTFRPRRAVPDGRGVDGCGERSVGVRGRRAHSSTTSKNHASRITRRCTRSTSSANTSGPAVR